MRMPVPVTLLMQSLTPALVAVLLLLPACSGPQQSVDQPPDLPVPSEPPPSETSVRLSDYEDFDPSPYDEAEAEDESLKHDVPPQLMTGKQAAGIATSMQGFRVQVAQTDDKSGADAIVADAVAWWRDSRDRTDLPALFAVEDPPVYIVYKAPYYRVRIGDFATRGEAMKASQIMRTRFSAAAVVPDEVSVVRAEK